MKPGQERSEQRPGIGQRRLYLLLTRALCSDPPLAVLRRALEGGVDLVQVREKPFGDDARAWIDRVRAACAPFGAPVVVNDRLDLARATGADGVHLGQEDLAALDRRTDGNDLLLGISTHDPAEMDRALREGPDYVGIGPCFATETKGLTAGRSDAAIRELLELASVPAFAIGGITAGNLPRLLDLGVRRIAVSAAILRAGAPDEAATELRRLLDRAG